MWSDRPITSITKRDVDKLIDAIRTRGAPILANRVLAKLRGLFAFCVAKDIITTSPAAGLKPTREETRDRTLTDAELLAVWDATAQLGYPFGPMFRLIILTAQRRAEVAGMRWSELSDDLTKWTLPTERSKNGKAHETPLPAAATAILSAMPRLWPDLIFSPDGIRPSSGFSCAMTRLVRICGVEGFTLHDLRRTAATTLAMMGIPQNVTERILNHTAASISGVAAIYNRHSYADERRVALEAWAQHVEGLGQEKAENIIPLRGKENRS